MRKSVYRNELKKTEYKNKITSLIGGIMLAAALTLFPAGYASAASVSVDGNPSEWSGVEMQDSSSS